MKRYILPFAALALMTAAAPAAAQTLDEVKQRDYLQCGSNTGLIGFGAPDDKGEWKGFDVDYCRAIAAAIFGDPQKVRFTPLTATERFTALQSRQIDVLVRNTTWTMSRDAAMGLNFAGVNYYDGQGFMVRKSLGVTSALELSNASICVQTGTTTELNLADYFETNKMIYKTVAFERLDQVNASYGTGACDAYTTDASGLYAIRLTQTNPDEHMVLPEVISKEPFGPVVRQGDDQWFQLVKWVNYAMLNAEELGVTSENVDDMRTSKNPNIRRLLGAEGEFGKSIGLTEDWAYNIIKMVGNYGEVFDRNIGAGSPLGISRGLNALWTEGGLHYAPPIR